MGKVHAVSSVKTPVSDAANNQKSSKRFNQNAIIAFAGIIYLGMTLYGSLTFFMMAETIISNDLLWNGLNFTGAAVFVSDAFNLLTLDLALPQEHTFQLTDKVFGSLHLYDQMNPTLQTFPTYARTVQYYRLTKVEDGIKQIRSMSTLNSPYIGTQYCWVDFDRRWSLAHTQKRAERCLENEKDNGAVYLESMLRNSDYQSFVNDWGLGFTLGIVNPLNQFNGGPEWLKSIQNPLLSIHEEAKFWKRKGIKRFVIQFSNLYQIGLRDQISISSAVGTKTNVTIKSNPSADRSYMWTTIKMYWTFAYDLWIISVPDFNLYEKSLIRESPDFFGNIISMHDIFESNLFFDPNSIVDTRWHELIGPYGSIDMKHRAVPSKVMQVYMETHRLLNEIFISESSDGWKGLVNLPTGPMTHLPMKWYEEGWSFVSGNPLCHEQSVPSPVILEFFTFEDMCGTTFFYASDVTLLYQIIVSYVIAMSGMDPSEDTIASICKVGTDSASMDSCIQRLSILKSFVSKYFTNKQRQYLHQLTQEARQEIMKINPELIQFATRPSLADGTPEYKVLRQDILPFNENDPWNYFGWMYIYEWIIGFREVVSFEGDYGTVTLMTGTISPYVTTPNAAEIPSSMSFYMLRNVQYVTFVFIIVAVIILFYTIINRAEISGWNCFQFNRVVGVVWVGRPLLIVRGLIAVGILSTCRLVVTKKAEFKLMEDPQQDLISTILTAGESGWLGYVIQDMCIVLTQEFTHAYAGYSSLMIWFVVAIIQLTLPVKHEATLDVQCEYVQFTEIFCHSGHIQIGHVSRVFLIIGLTIGINFVGFFTGKYFRKPREIVKGSAFCLPGIAQHLFARSLWFDSEEWSIDSASGAIAGLLSIRIGRWVGALDVKSWSWIESDKASRNPQSSMGKGQRPRHPATFCFTHRIPLHPVSFNLDSPPVVSHQHEITQQKQQGPSISESLDLHHEK